MHISSRLRMKWFEENYASKINKASIKILDVGSYDVNGSYRDIFENNKYAYLGMDMEKGPNVDIILNNPYDWSKIETDSFDIVISGQAFEHIEFFWITMGEMARVLKKDGLLCIIAPNGFPEHRYPVDCYRFFCDGMVALARYTSLEPIHADTNEAPPNISNWQDWYSKKFADSMLVAKKTYSGETKYVDFKKYVCIQPDQKKLSAGFEKYNLKSKKVIDFAKGLFPNKLKDIIKNLIKVISIR